MDDIALTNTLLENKINICDENILLNNNSLSNTLDTNKNNNNKPNKNANVYQTPHKNSLLASNFTEQINQRRNKKTNSYLKHKYNLPVEIIDYDNIENSSLNSLINNTHFKTSNIDLRSGYDISLSTTTAIYIKNNKMQQQNQQQANKRQSMTTTTVTETNFKSNPAVDNSLTNLRSPINPQFNDKKLNGENGGGSVKEKKRSY